MVLAEPKTIHDLKELEDKFATPHGEPDKTAYRQIDKECILKCTACFL